MLEIGKNHYRERLTLFSHMRVETENYTFEIEDSWGNEAGFDLSSINAQHYKADLEKSNGKKVFLIHISDINPKIRGDGVPVFNDGEVEGIFSTAKERMVSILRAVMSNSALPPVEVVDCSVDRYKYKLAHGSHRIFCSIAAGFKQIPAVYSFDITNC